MRCSDLARTASLSGLALLCGGAAGAPQLVPNDQATTLRPSRMASVDYIDGRYIRTSAWIDCSAPASARGVFPVRVVYDASGLSFEDNDFDGLPDGAACGDLCAAAIGGTASTRWAFPELGSSVVDDYDISDGPAGEGSVVDGFNAMVNLSHTGCDEFYTLFALWDSVDGTGTGFDTDGDGVVDDAIDRGPSGSAAFLGGVVTEWTTTTCPDTDMDGVPDGASIGGGAGYAVLDTGFNTGSGWIANNIGIPLTDSDAGGIELILAGAYLDSDNDGVEDTVVARTDAFPMLWGTDEEQLSFDGATLLPGSPGCTGRLGLSSSAIWGSNTPGFTPDEFFALEDPTMTSCPNPFSAAIAFYANESLCRCTPDCNGNGIVDVEDILNGTSQDANRDGLPDECPAGRNRRCSDVNANGVHAEPADFVAWLALFNDPGDKLAYRADVNNNGRIQEPSDFVQWLSYFNAPATVPGDCLD